MPEKTKGSMSVREAGSKGGSKTSERYGHEFYEGIGKKGGQKGWPNDFQTVWPCVLRRNWPQKAGRKSAS